jgi:hypothetical protein
MTMEMAMHTKTNHSPLRRLAVLFAALATTCALFAATAPAAPAAAFEVTEFDGEILRNDDDAPATEAGSHPYAITNHMAFATTENIYGWTLPAAQPKDIRVTMPVGLVGNLKSVPRCRVAQFYENEDYEGAASCPNDTAIGYVKILIADPDDPVTMYSALFHMPPRPGKAARFGFHLMTANVFMDVSVRTGEDYGVEVVIPDTPQALPMIETDLVVWGVPADPRHDAMRGQCLGRFGSNGQCSANADQKPFLTMPTTCGAPLVTGLRTNAWTEPDNWQEESFVHHDAKGDPVALEGCEELEFEPSLEIQADGNAASPTGLRAQITLPQDESVEGRVSSHLKDAVVTLPQGFELNAAAANGLGACSAAQIGIDNRNPAACPPSSKIGTVQVVSPALNNPMGGSVYLAKQGENPFGSTLAAYIVAEGEGVLLKLPGRIDTDPVTGQITTTFPNNPQLPFSELTVDFFGGSNGVLIAPPSCGTYTVTSALTPWSGTGTVNPSDSISIGSGPNDGPCPNGGFDPKLSAGTINPVAGQFSPFTLRVTREDGMRALSAIDVTLPPGVLAKLTGVPYCPEAALAAIPTAVGTGAGQAAAPSCPAASQVGTLSVGAGAGNNPVYVPGRVYLAGPYKGAPLSLAFVTPALAGPLDLGNVVVRSALHVDPETARVRAVSDPLPTILAGIPLNLRDIRVTLDRDGFTLNPTSCDPMGIGGQIAGAGGVVARVSQRFQAASCAALGFQPKLSLRLSGPTRRAANPGLKAVLSARPGDANIGRAVVTLPKTQFLDQGHIRTICTRVQYAADSCPKAAIYGYAKAWTPLLGQPLEGPVYLRSSSNELPDLVADLDGQIEIDLAGRIDSVNSRMRTTFAAVPDAAISRFVLTMQGGRKGLLENNIQLCGAKPRAKAAFTGQNGKRSVSNPLVKVACGKGAGRSK